MAQVQESMRRPHLREVPSPAQAGFNRLTKRLLVVQAVVAIATLLAYKPLGLSINWTSGLPLFAFDLVIAGLWVHLWSTPGLPKEWFIAETVAAFLLMLTASHVFAPAQYVAVALKRPLVDPALAAADAALGINVATIAKWTAAHASFDAIMRAAYVSFLPQLAVLVPLLGIGVRDREAMWEAVFHYHVCAVITVGTLAVFPAASAFQYLHFQSTLDQTRFISQFDGLRSGAFTTIRLDSLEGLVSMPSFHCAGAVIVVWALRRTRALFWTAMCLNVLLALSTVFTGAHYAVDLAGTAAMFLASVALWNRYGLALLQGMLNERIAPQTIHEIARSSVAAETTGYIR